MSFSAEVKNELCKIPLHHTCCARAELYGVLLYCNTFNAGEIRIITENEEFAARLPRLLHKAFNLHFDQLSEKAEIRGKQVLGITDREKLARIINAFGYDPAQTLALHVNFGILEEECCRAAFLRGVFLAGGSVTDPAKRYHLELATSHYKVSRELDALLLDMGFEPKSVLRNYANITYFKQSEAIEDLLTLIGAPVAAMDMMAAKVEKDLRNRINRKLNCDTANLDKAVGAAQSQIEAIHALEKAGRLEQLPEKLKETARLRVKHPDFTLLELTEEFTPPLTKSCLNHRLRKIMEEYKKLQEV